MKKVNHIELIRSLLREVHNFPKPGINFYDITTVISNKDGLNACLEAITECLSSHSFDKVAAIDARGFIFGAAIADRLSKGFIPIRKKGKLPGKTLSCSYKLEYGEATIEISDIAASSGEKILLIDDLLATGGTAQAAVKLIKMLGAEVIQVVFLIEICALNGRKNIEGCPIESVIKL